MYCSLRRNVADLVKLPSERNSQEMDMEYLPTNSSSKRRSRRRGGPKRIKTGKGPVVDQSSSDSNKVLNIADILLQARDIRTRKWKVFVEWDDRSPIDLESLLCGGTCSVNAVIRCSENMFLSLPLSGPLPTTDDEQGTESTVSDEERDVSSSSDSD